MTWGLTNAAWDIAPISYSNQNGQEDQPAKNERPEGFDAWQIGADFVDNSYKSLEDDSNSSIRYYQIASR
jgi:hypothetical protein